VPALVRIFRTHLGQDLKGADLRPAAVAARGKTGADVERVVREARSAARRAGVTLTVAHLVNAVLVGEPDLPPDLRRRFAFHEAGHAVDILALGQRKPIALSVCVDGGFARSGPTEPRAETREHVENQIVMLLAGRAAEEVISGNCTAGAGRSERSDLALATDLAIRLETMLGLGHSGLVDCRQIAPAISSSAATSTKPFTQRSMTPTPGRETCWPPTGQRWKSK